MGCVVHSSARNFFFIVGKSEFYNLGGGGILIGVRRQVSCIIVSMHQRKYSYKLSTSVTEPAPPHFLEANIR